ncbi:MAG: F0F1 ATP synthase subunit delta [Pseudomonadota bacterium]
MAVSSETSSIAGRYATALFELADEAGALDAVEKDLAAVADALGGSEDLRRAVASPLYSREELGGVVASLAAAMKLSPLTGNVLGLMAQKRRLFALEALCVLFARMMADRRGEVTAEVATAQAMTKKQMTALSAALKQSVGRDVKLETTVDESLIGGLVVKVGSKLIDTSIRSKLASLQNAMREVG